MIKLKNNNGITLLILLITIVVFGIILGVTIELSTDSIRSSIKTQETAELLIVQHAIAEKATEAKEKNDPSVLVGEPGTIDDKPGIFYLLSTEENFKDLGLSGESITESQFIVNYQTGYVEKLDSSATPLEGYVNDSAGNTTSHMIQP